MTDRPTPDARRADATQTPDAPAGLCPICGGQVTPQRTMLQCRRCGFAQCSTCNGEVADVGD